MKRIVHIVNDEKFIKNAYEQFESLFPNQCLWIIISNSRGQFKYLPRIKDNIIVRADIKELKKIDALIPEKALICVHGLDYYRSVVVNALSRKRYILWFLWGMEVYNNSKIYRQEEILGDVTYHIFFKKTKVNFLKDKVKNSFRQMFYKMKYRTNEPELEVVKAIKKADSCAVIFQEECENVAKRVESKFHFVEFTYYPIDKIITDKALRITNSNILLGNSASYSNNHIEAIYLLEKFDLNERELIVPLNYGNKDYGQYIKQEANKRLSIRVNAVMEFMPLESYNELLKTCGIVIMNHYRQQAVGNILAMIYMGAKVYLDERNSVFHYLKRIGVKVYSIQKDLRPDDPECLNLLNIEMQQRNRKLIEFKLSNSRLEKILFSEITSLLQ